MRLWSLHPRHLDQRGLVALWREALLAQAVLRGETKGYLHHPQLWRLREQPDPVGAIATYLRSAHAEAERRGYRFDAGKIARASEAEPIAVTKGQLQFEWRHLVAKVAAPDPAWLDRLLNASAPEPHPLFTVVPGGVAA